MAAASGCSLASATAAAACSSERRLAGAAAITCCTWGRPSVRVPVLSTTRVSTVLSSSLAAASLNNTPNAAPRPVATMIDIGVANPRAHGQAMINTATALSNAMVPLGPGPNIIHTAKVRPAMAITAGTKMAETESATR